MYSYEFKPQAIRDLKKLPKDIQVRIIKKLDYFVSAEDPLVFADHLINYELGSCRFRVGDYRIIFDVVDEIIIILTIGNRKEIYR
jgi:mRNA interferase RelE/StbE